jgi:hypothetical protein
MEPSSLGCTLGGDEKGYRMEVDVIDILVKLTDQFDLVQITASPNTYSNYARIHLTALRGEEEFSGTGPSFDAAVKSLMLVVLGNA